MTEFLGATESVRIWNISLMNRLKEGEGQIRGIESVENDAYCPDILIQDFFCE